MKEMKGVILKMASEGRRAKEIAEATGASVGHIYNVCHRSGIAIRRNRLKDAAFYSVDHGIDEAAKKFDVTVESVHTARWMYL